MNAPAEVPFIAQGPQPLYRELPVGDPYPVDMLGPLAEVAKAVADVTQAPVGVAGQSALAAASLAVQAFGDVETLAGHSPVSIFALTVAQSGERKSGCDKKLTGAIQEFERLEVDQYKIDYADFDAASKLWDAKQSRLIRDAAGTGDKAVSALADLEAQPPRPVAPLSPYRIAGDPTLEGLLKHLANAQPSAGIFSDEGGGFIGGYAMNSDNRLKTVAGLSKLWDGAPVNRTRAGDGVSTLYGRRVAAHLMLQPVAAAPLLSDPVANQQGFLARFLISMPPSTIGTRLRVGHDAASDTAIDRYSDRIASALRSEPVMREGTTNELAPRVIPLAAEARALLLKYHRETELAQAAGGELETVRPFASKSAEQACRIAGVLALYRGLSVSEVSLDDMASGVAIASHHLEEARRLSNTAEIAAETLLADRLREWLQTKWAEDFVTIKAVSNYGPNQIRERKAAKKLIPILEDHGWLIAEPGGAVVKGEKARTAWRVVR